MLSKLFAKVDLYLTENKNNVFGFWLFITAKLFVFTLIVKFLVEKFDLPVFLNSELAFSIPFPLPLIFLLYLTVAIIIFKYLYDSFSVLPRISQFGWVLIIAGGLANIFERIVYGFVTDYIFIFTAVFNLADFYLIAGALLLVVRNTKSGESISAQK